MAMDLDSPDRSSPSSAGEIQGSPLFNFLCSLSPIKSVKSARVAQTYSEISFPPPPAVFVSPRVGTQKGSSSIQRNQGANGVEASTTLETGPVLAQKEGRHALMSTGQRVQKLRSIRKSQKCQSFPSPNSSPSKLVEEYLAPPVDEDLGTEEDLELLPDSSTCEIKAASDNINSRQVGGMQFIKEETVLKALPNLLERNGSYLGQIGPIDNRCTQDARSSKSSIAISSLKHVAHESGDVNNDDILDFEQEAANLEFLMSEDVDESHHAPGMEDWHNVTSSNLSDLSVEQVEGYIASLRGIVNEEQEVLAGFSTQLSTEIMADESHMPDSLDSEPEAKGSRGAAATCKVSASNQRGARRRCLDFEVSEGHMQSETGSVLSLKAMPSNLGTKCQEVSLCGAESNRSVLVLKKRVSATLGAMRNDTIRGLDVCTGGCSSKEGTASIKMTRATSINIKLSRCSSLKDTDSRLSCTKTSPIPAGMPSGIGLHLNSLTSSMPCTQMREFDGSAGPITALKSANTFSTGMLTSKMQGSPVEGTQKGLVPLNPGRHAYAGSTAESRQGLVALMPETRTDDCELLSEGSDQDIESSKLAIRNPSGHTLVHDVAPLNVYKRPSPLGRKRVLLQDKNYQAELEGGEESNQSPYSPKKKRRSSSTADKSGDGCKRCNCKKSKCLKLYCECFAAGVYCVDSCTCQGCFNKPEFEETVMDTRQQIMSRNPLAFAPKIIRASEPSPTKREDSRETPASARHKRGCNCKKSHCLKKYCECFQAGVGCSDGCRCESCKNVHGRKEGSQDLDENELQVEDVVDKELAEEHIGTSEPCTELIHGSQHRKHELSPITPAFQHGGQHRPTTKLSASIKRRGSLEVLRSPAFSLSSVKPSSRSPSKIPRSPSRLLRSCKGVQNSPPMTSTGGIVPSGSSPVSTPRILRIGRFSPRWDGLDEICTLTPGIQAPLRPTPASASLLDTADMSPSLNEQNCNELLSTAKGPVRQSSKFSHLTSPISQQQSSQCRTPANMQGTSGTQTPFSPPGCGGGMDNKPFYEESEAYSHQFLEDNGTPEFLKDAEPEYLPICLLNSSSPKHKRVSPPHHHALREAASHRGLQSPAGVRSSRKFILQSISSVPFTAGHEKLNGNKCHKAET